MNPITGLRTAVELLRTPYRSFEEILSIQRGRFAELVSFAQRHSPFYRELYAGVPWSASTGTLPPVSKEVLNENLGRVVTDPRVRPEALEAYLRAQDTVGTPFEGGLVVLRTSGTTGRTGTVLYDAQAWALFKILSGVRGVYGDGRRRGLAGVARFLSRRHRIAYVIAGRGHFSTAMLSSIRPRWTRIWCEERVFPIQDDFETTLKGLQSFQPEVIHLYPSFAGDLARAQASGAVTLDPVALSTSSERLDPASRDSLREAFPRARVSDCYGTTECLVLARQCPLGDTMHVNSDWVVLEPVDAQDRPVGYGEPSHHVLVTNLANRVMPIIRYRIDDVVTSIPPGPCECGSNLPRIRIQGRNDHPLKLVSGEGQVVSVSPLAVGSTMTRVDGLDQFQIVQESTGAIAVRYIPSSGETPARIEADIHRALLELLRQRSRGAVPPIHVRRVDRISRDPISGKVQRIHCQFEPSAPDPVRKAG